MLNYIIDTAIFAVGLPQTRITMVLLFCVMLAYALSFMRTISYPVVFVNWETGKLETHTDWNTGFSLYITSGSLTLLIIAVYGLVIVIPCSWWLCSTSIVVQVLAMNFMLLWTTVIYAWWVTLTHSSVWSGGFDRSEIWAVFSHTLGHAFIFMRLTAMYRVCVLLCLINGLFISPGVLNPLIDFYAGDLPYSVERGTPVDLLNLCLAELAYFVIWAWYGSGVGGAFSSVNNAVIGLISLIEEVWDSSFSAIVVHCDSSNSGFGLGGADNSGYIPWADGATPRRSRAILNAQYEYSKEAYPLLYDYLSKHCTHLYAPPTGNTGIKFEQFDAAHLKAEGYPLITPVYSTDLLKGKNQVPAGVYVFAGIDGEASNLYIGSTITSTNRFKYHYQVSRWPSQKWPMFRLYDALAGGYEKYVLAIVAESTNHYTEFTSLHPEWLSTPDRNRIWRILNDHSQYEARLLEHSAIKAIGPGLNDPNREVSFPVKWKPTDAFEPKGTSCIVELGDTGVKMPFSSLQRASDYVGMRKDVLSLHMNYGPGLISKEVGPFTVYKEGIPLFYGEPPRWGPTYPSVRLADFDYDRLDRLTLKPNCVYAISDNDQVLGIYSTISRASEDFKINTEKLSLAINKVSLQPALPFAGLVFFAINWDTYYKDTDKRMVRLTSPDKSVYNAKGKPVVCENLNTGEVLQYYSQHHCALALGYKKSNSSWRDNYVIGSKVLNRFNVSYKLCYAEDYKGAVTPIQVPWPTKLVFPLYLLGIIRAKGITEERGGGSFNSP